MNGYKIGAGGGWEEAGEGNPGKWPDYVCTAYADRDMDQTVRQLDQGDPDVAKQAESEHNALAAAARVGSATVPATLAAGEWELPSDADEEDPDDMDTSGAERLHPELERLIARLNDDLDALAIVSKDGRRERPSPQVARAD